MIPHSLPQSGVVCIQSSSSYSEIAVILALAKGIGLGSGGGEILGFGDGLFRYSRFPMPNILELFFVFMCVIMHSNYQRKS